VLQLAHLESARIYKSASPIHLCSKHTTVKKSKSITRK
jgi:hypothetical protein